MAFTRYTISVVADIDVGCFPNDYSEKRIEVVCSRSGVRVADNGDGTVKIQAIKTDIQLGGMTNEEYIQKIHAQVHKDHEDDPEGGAGGNNSPTTH